MLTSVPPQFHPALSKTTFYRDLVAGLSQPNKSIPCKYFYDERGAQLFEAICDQSEYYPTRTELQILRDNIGEIAKLLGPRCALVDLGSGNGAKMRLLLEHLDSPSAYLPVDVSHAQLSQTARRLAQDYPSLDVLPVCADFTTPLPLPPLPAWTERIVAFFPGGTIGNFEPTEASQFLAQLRQLCTPGGALLLGVDLPKSAAILEPAYNDTHGATAKFNLNLLARANRELSANFDLSLFTHRAIYNERATRVEMHLVSRCPQTVFVAGRVFSFAEGESICTEHSYKYSPEKFRTLATSSGWNPLHCWLDQNRWFSVHYLVPA